MGTTHSGGPMSRAPRGAFPLGRQGPGGCDGNKTRVWWWSSRRGSQERTEPRRTNPRGRGAGTEPRNEERAPGSRAQQPASQPGRPNQRPGSRLSAATGVVCGAPGLRVPARPSPDSPRPGMPGCFARPRGCSVTSSYQVHLGHHFTPAPHPEAQQVVELIGAPQAFDELHGSGSEPAALTWAFSPGPTPTWAAAGTVQWTARWVGRGPREAPPTPRRPARLLFSRGCPPGPE